MSLLTKTTEQDLFNFFKSISPADVRGYTEPRVYKNGKVYHEDERVSDVSANIQKTFIDATVKGTTIYDVTLMLTDSNIYATCSCGKIDICKHIVSVLLFGIHDRSFIHHPENQVQEKALSLTK